jgi:hypothetical protein
MPTNRRFKLVRRPYGMPVDILTQWVSRIGGAIPDLMAWVKEGKLRIDEHIDEGIENALAAFLRLFQGTDDSQADLSIGSRTRRQRVRHWGPSGTTECRNRRSPATLCRATECSAAAHYRVFLVHLRTFHRPQDR